MGYKTICVCLNNIAENKKLLDSAAGLASTFGAHVNGIYIIPAPQIYPSGAIDIIPVVVDASQIFFRDNASAVSEAFESRMRQEGVNHSFIKIDSGSTYLADDMIAASEIADLVVCMGAGEKTTTGMEDNFLERLIMSIGRPILVLPKQYAKPLNFDEIVVGWNGSKESARAVFDALPILKLASNVHVTVVDPQKIDNLRGELAGVDIVESLSRHAIKATADTYPTNGEGPGAALIEHARDIGAGLIVMGAYGHSRLREYIFGGATRTILAELDRPVLMSH